MIKIGLYNVSAFIKNLVPYIKCSNEAQLLQFCLSFFWAFCQQALQRPSKF